MSNYFDDPDRAAALVAECQSWWGTPFHYYSRAKGRGGGIDCLGFCEEVSAAAGLERWSFERTGAGYSKHVVHDTIVNHLRGKEPNESSRQLAARWAELPVIQPTEEDPPETWPRFTEPPMVGDLVVYKDGSRTKGRGVFHMGLMISPTIFMQCATHMGVAEAQIDDPTYAPKLYAHFRARAVPLANA